ncbi:hypothetical protein [Nonomuraea sp. CA-141351]|uniref:hypothetical protein n=1 Tax=Nonomuraea sp. CA-141351 TaxID=3239996 RepID=UPI003D8DBBFB
MTSQHMATDQDTLLAGQIILIAEGGDLDQGIALQAAHLAATAGCPLTVALLVIPPWSLAFEPVAAYLFDDGEAELSALTLLTRALESVPVQWRLNIVTGAPTRTIAQLGSEHQTLFLAADGRRRWGMLRRPARIARSAARRNGFGVVLL